MTTPTDYIRAVTEVATVKTPFLKNDINDIFGCLDDLYQVVKLHQGITNTVTNKKFPIVPFEKKVTSNKRKKPNLGGLA
jgi:rRNA processing protein Gar1